MPQGFQPESQEEDYIPPELAEQVIERFAEREKQRQAERERLATMTHVNDLAELLGTTPDDVATLADELQKQAPIQSKAYIPTQLPPQQDYRWVVHAVYLSLIALAVLATVAATNKPPAAQPMTPPVFASPLPGVYTPNTPPGWFRQQDLIAPVLDKTVISPPAGFSIKVFGSEGTQLAVGSPGSVTDQRRAADQLGKSIRSLLTYVEGLSTVTGDIPTPNYSLAINDTSGSLGWHVLEINTGRNTMKVSLPDKRYAKDVSQYENVMGRRFEWLLDTKLFPDLEPGYLRPNSTKLKAELPYGTALMIFDSRRTAYVMGSKRSPAKTPYFELAGMTQRGIVNAIRQVTQKNLFPNSPPEMLQVRLVYPGGEVDSAVTLGMQDAVIDATVSNLSQSAAPYIASFNGLKTPLNRTSYGRGQPWQRK